MILSATKTKSENFSVLEDMKMEYAIEFFPSQVHNMIQISTLKCCHLLPHRAMRAYKFIPHKINEEMFLPHT